MSFDFSTGKICFLDLRLVNQLIHTLLDPVFSIYNFMDSLSIMLKCIENINYCISQDFFYKRGKVKNESNKKEEHGNTRNLLEYMIN